MILLPVAEVCLQYDDLLGQESVFLAIGSQAIRHSLPDLGASFDPRFLVVIVGVELRHVFVSGTAVADYAVAPSASVLAEVDADQDGFGIYDRGDLGRPGDVSHFAGDLD